MSGGWPLSPRAARVFYNAADAWLPDAPADFDAVAQLAAALPPAGRRRLERQLRLLEWSPRLALRSPRGLSWLARAERRAWLDRLERGGVGPARRAAARVHALVDACHAEAETRRSRFAASAGAASSAAPEIASSRDREPRVIAASSERLAAQSFGGA